MPGRPRTRLKRIAAWKQLALQLCEEIRQRIPEPYLKYEVDFDQYKKWDGFIRLEETPNWDPVAYQWKSLHDAAGDLIDQVWGLDRAIRRRLKDKGIIVDANPTPNPGENEGIVVDEPQELEFPPEAELHPAC